MRKIFTFPCYILFILLLLPARAMAADEQDNLSSICKKNTADIRCSGYLTPEQIPLKKRPGNKYNCSGSLIDDFSQRCHAIFDDTSITIFYRTSKDKKQSSELRIPFTSILDLSYPEHSRVTNIGYFGLIRTTRKLGLVEIIYQSSDDQHSKLSIGARRKTKKFLKFVDNFLANTVIDDMTYENNIPFDVNATETITSDQKQKLMEEVEEDKTCFRCNINGSNLENIDLSKAYLDESNFQDSNLSGAVFEGASLWRVNFENAILTEANLSSKTELRTDLRQVNFRNADLRRAILAGANLGRADLSGANLEGADLSVTGPTALIFAGQSKVKLNTHLFGVNLESANLTDANLTKANLQWANLSNVNLESADLRKANFDYANLSNTNLSNASFGKASFRKANLSGSNLDISGIKSELLCEAVLPNGTRSTDLCEDE